MVKEAETQRVINTIIELLKTHKDLKQVTTWIPMPNMDRMIPTPPFANVFAMEKAHRQHGFQDIYEYTLSVGLILAHKHTQSQDRSRRIHVYEEAIEDVIIKNRQPEIKDITVQQMRVVSSSYQELVTDKLSLDALVMRIDVDYNRVVPQ